MKYSEQTELEVLNAVLIKQDNLYQLMEYDRGLFYFAENVTIFEALKELYEEGKQIDTSILSLKLKEYGQFEPLEPHLINILKAHTPLNLVDHFRTLSDLRDKRQLLLLSKDLYTAVKNNDITYQDFLNKLSEINDNRNSTKNSEYTTIKQLSETSLDDLFKSSNYIRTRIQGIDDKIIGLFNGQLVIIAGRPKMGKTTLAIQIMKNIKDKVLFFSMEMKRTEIYAKILSNDSNVTSWKIELNKMDTAEYDRVANTHMRIKDQINITLFDGAYNASKIKSTIRKFCKVEKPVAVFIDYLQLITGGQGENQNLRISSITRDLKLLAMELNIPIVLLSQLSRESEKQNRRPVMSDLRDSGSIEQDADIIIFAHEQDLKTEIIVGANRKGKAGIIEGIIFDKEFSRFRDAEETFEYVGPDYIHN